MTVGMQNGFRAINLPNVENRKVQVMGGALTVVSAF